MSAPETRVRSAWEMPLYADKPRRRIPGTDYVAVTMHRSTDGTVRQFAVFSADGVKRLGTAYYQHPRGIRSRGYAMTQFPMFHDEKWRTLAEFATEMDRRLT